TVPTPDRPETAPPPHPCLHAPKTANSHIGTDFQLRAGPNVKRRRNSTNFHDFHCILVFPFYSQMLASCSCHGSGSQLFHPCYARVRIVSSARKAGYSLPR